MRHSDKPQSLATPEVEEALVINRLSEIGLGGPRLSNRFGLLLELYVVAEDPVSGVLIKLLGEVALNQVTGQLVTTFDETRSCRS
jgi:hypothetical protein